MWRISFGAMFSVIALNMTPYIELMWYKQIDNLHFPLKYFKSMF